MLYEGIDAHKTDLTLAIADNNGDVVHEEQQTPAGGEALLAAL